MVTREEVINNLWLTEEISEELKIIEHELKKKERLLQATVEESRSNYLKLVETEYYESVEYKSAEDYQKLTKKFESLNDTILLISRIIMTLFCLILIYMEIPLLHVAILWLVTPYGIYLPCYGWKKIELSRKRPAAEPKTVEEILKEAKEALAYQQIPDSLLANYIKQEIIDLNHKKEEYEEMLLSKTILPPMYQRRAKKVVWYLENKVADNLKEALSVLDEADYRKKVEHILETQNSEIKTLKKRLSTLMEEKETIRKRMERVEHNKRN